MHLRVLSREPLEDGWTETALLPPPAATARAGNQVGDTVLYRLDGKLTPAVLVAAAGQGCWLARDARHTQGLIYLGTEHIAARLPRLDLLDEAA